jgi:hypothetical protein
LKTTKHAVNLSRRCSRVSIEGVWRRTDEEIVVNLAKHREGLVDEDGVVCGELVDDGVAAGDQQLIDDLAGDRRGQAGSAVRVVRVPVVGGVSEDLIDRGASVIERLVEDGGEGGVRVVLKVEHGDLRVGG